MIKIRSTEKLATSNSQGLCDIVRTLSKFTFDLEKNQIGTIVTDQLFQEQEVEIDEVTVVERRIIESRQGKAYLFNIEDIDNFYQIIGSSITKTKGFSTGLKENLVSVLIAQTAEASRQTMSNWIPDTEHILVKEFTEIE